MTTPVVAIDLGGTNVRFAIAWREADGHITLDQTLRLATRDFPSLASVWAAFAAQAGQALPAAASLAVACPVGGEVLHLTNSPWQIRPAQLRQDLGLRDLTVINDFAAMAHAVAVVGESDLAPIAGPAGPLPRQGVISVIGPGTGLGVGACLRDAGRVHILPSEAGHIDFAPRDEAEDAILLHLRGKFGRVSAERVISGPGLGHLAAAIAAISGRPMTVRDDAALWQAALDGSDALAAAALDRLCLCYGAFAGDVALAHGAAGVVLAGSLSQRMQSRLQAGPFARRFTDKGRLTSAMAALPIRLLLHPQPGLLGAAAAYFAAGHTR